MGKKIANIKAGIYIAAPAELQMSVNGERLSDYEKHFNSLYYDKIKSAINHDNWGIWFKQIDELKPKFVVDIYPVSLTDLHDYLIIKNIIGSNLPSDIEIELMAPYWDFQRFVDETV